MRIDRFTQKAQEAVHEAQHLAQEYNHPAIEPEHLLKVLIEQEGGVIPSVLNRIGANWRLVVTIGLACTPCTESRNGSGRRRGRQRPLALTVRGDPIRFDRPAYCGIITSLAGTLPGEGGDLVGGGPWLFLTPFTAGDPIPGMDWRSALSHPGSCTPTSRSRRSTW
jgi:hypothetical protein